MGWLREEESRKNMFLFPGQPAVVLLCISAVCQTTLRSGYLLGLIYGATEFLNYGVRAATYYYGAVVVDNGDCSFGDMFKVRHSSLPSRARLFLP